MARWQLTQGRIASLAITWTKIATPAFRTFPWVRVVFYVWAVLGVAASIRTLVNPEQHTTFPIFAQVPSTGGTMSLCTWSTQESIFSAIARCSPWP